MNKGQMSARIATDTPYTTSVAGNRSPSIRLGSLSIFLRILGRRCSRKTRCVLTLCGFALPTRSRPRGAERPELPLYTLWNEMIHGGFSNRGH